jgi:outer membrane protein, heavy metal efflux system
MHKYRVLVAVRYFTCLTWLASAALLAQEPARVGPAIEQLPPAQPSNSAFTLAGLEQLALERNPTLVQATAQIGVSRGKAIEAGLYPNPTVGYVADQIGARGTAGEMQGLFVQQEIVRGGKLALSRAKYQQEEAQAQTQAEAQRYRVHSSVRKAFYVVLTTQRQIEVRREMVTNADDALTTTRGLVNVGQANSPDLLQAEVQVDRARAELRAAERKYRCHWQELMAYVGVPEMAPSPLAGVLEVTDQDVLDAEAVLTELLQSSPQLQAAWQEVARDRIALQREQVEPIPNLQFRAETGYNFETNNTVAGATVGLRLPIFDRNQGSIIQARHELVRAEAEIVRIELMLRQKFGDAYGDYAAALERARAFEKSMLPKSRAAYESYLEAFRNRRAAWPQVLVAQRDYFQLSDEYLATLLELRKSEAEIRGFFLGDGLEHPPAPTPQGHLEATPRPR